MKLFVRTAVLLATFLYLYTHLASSRIDASRDATMFGTVADSTRTIHLRTDFASFYYACKAALHGGNMYDARYLDSLAADDKVANHVLPYLYPPFFAIIARPLGLMVPTSAQQVWDFLAVALFCLTVSVVGVTPKDAGSFAGNRPLSLMQTVLVGVLCYVLVRILPFTTNLDFGQINFLVLFLMAASFYFSANNTSDVLAGALLGIAALIKVTPALCVLFFLVQRKWKVVNSFLLTGGAVIGATLLLGDAESWRQFVVFLPDIGYAKNVSGGFHPGIAANVSVAGFFLRLAPGDVLFARQLTYVAVACLLAVLFLFHFRSRNDERQLRFVLPYCVVLIIASPVAWLHHCVYLFPGVVFLVRDLGVEEGRSGMVKSLVIGTLVFLCAKDFPSLYPSWTIAEGWRPVVTSMNLFFLLAVLGVSLRWTASGRSVS